MNKGEARREAKGIAAAFLRNCMESGVETFMIDDDNDRTWKSQADADRVERELERIIRELEEGSRLRRHPSQR